ncbi:hypothetical protein CHARACLAT_019500 [Characodon lateralis]|uniref:Uncharacterized protein n=1 Tax=Characodon lateralis TaxID=208331 RepID=A0ABU7EM86_9TELE|nr:hypothetical protein [Characodon lateralis]
MSVGNQKAGSTCSCAEVCIFLPSSSNIRSEMSSIHQHAAAAFLSPEYSRKHVLASDPGTFLVPVVYSQMVLVLLSSAAFKATCSVLLLTVVHVPVAGASFSPQ